MSNRLLLALGLVFVAFFVATGLYANAEEESSDTGTTASSSASWSSDIIKVAGRYTVRESWLAPPTASEIGVTSFQESPALAALVASGDLPAVGERLPDDPMVQEPYGDVGVYGGDLRVARMGPGDWGDLHRGSRSFLFKADPSLNLIIPHLMESYELNDDATVLTFGYRAGHKWSDGNPFTSADLQWWFDNVVSNPELAISKREYMNGEPAQLAEMVALDETTTQITFVAPLTPTKLVPLLNWYRTKQGRFYGSHVYASQFHKDFNDKAEAQAAEAGFDSWVAHFRARIDMNPKQNFVQPELSTWVFESRDSSGTVRVRNPYYFAVDTAGNQLPYIDRMISNNFSDSEVAILSMMQGKIDIGGRLMAPASFPLYIKNQELGGYNIREWQDTKASRVIFLPNFNSLDAVKGPVLFDKRFRQALSLGLNRDEINEFVFLGMATPTQFTVDIGARFFKQEWADSYSAYDPEGAKAKLDEMGMVDTDGDGWRETPKGEKFVLDMRSVQSSVLGTMGSAIAELTRDYWNEIGIDINFKEISEDLQWEQLRAQELDIVIFVSEMTLPSRLSNPPSFGQDTIIYSMQWKHWDDHNKWEASGKIGEEPPIGEAPPAEWQEWLANWDAWVNAPNDAEFDRIGELVWDFQAEQLPIIGTVAKAARPILINNRINNVPDVLPFSFGSFLWVQTNPHQWYIQE